MDYSKVLSQQFQIKEEYAQNIISLLDDGNTIPFIARYRKEMHGAMDDTVLRTLETRLTYLRNIEKRKDEVRKLITEMGKMTDEVEAAIEAAQTITEVDDIYRPFRPHRKTRASVAKEKGLERQRESLRGLKKLGLTDQDDVIFLGYPENGLRTLYIDYNDKMKCFPQLDCT